MTRDEKARHPTSRPSRDTTLALVAIVGIALHLVLRFAFSVSSFAQELPLYLTLLLGGAPLVYDLFVKLLRREFGSDLLAGLSIVTSAVLGEYLAGALVVLMLSGGQVLENYAVRSASYVLRALAKRMPNVAHVRRDGSLVETPLDKLAIGDTVVVYPHDTCPVDGVVVEGHGVMDESYLTGEPFEIAKTPGSAVLSGAINGLAALSIRATRLPQDSRYAKIMRVMREAEENRPELRRLADQLGAYYTPVAIALSLVAWLASGDAVRFLAVLVVATPCPLLIAIPVTIIGSISLAAKRGIIIKDPAVLEQLDTCRTIIFDKTGTLTYGVAQLTEVHLAAGFGSQEVLRLVASVEQYSKHPLARAILQAAAEAKVPLADASQIREVPGEGLQGTIAGQTVEITSRKRLHAHGFAAAAALPAPGSGLECVVVVDGAYAATYRFHDMPRPESKSFVGHLQRNHHYEKVMLVSGDRESEVRYLADQVGIHDVRASTSPEEKVAIVRQETAKARTMFLGDGINDAPALMTATVGIAFGQASDVTAEAAGAVIMDTSLAKVDELFHIGRRLRSIALQSAVGGMLLSILGMLVAAGGYLPPVAGAVTQEIIDLLAIANALRAAFPPRALIDFRAGS